MLPLHHDPGRDTSCRGIRLVQIIASVLATSSVGKSGRPDSNRRSQAPRACGLARLSHALIVPPSSPCGNRTHLFALKGRYPRPIDERANDDEWAGWRSNPRLRRFSPPLDRLSYRPVLADPTKRPGVFVTPGPRLRARDVRGRASRPQGVERERARRLLGGSLRFLTTQDVTRTPGEHGRPRCDGCLRPTRWTGLAARPWSCTPTDAAPREDVRAIPMDYWSPARADAQERPGGNERAPIASAQGEDAGPLARPIGRRSCQAIGGGSSPFATPISFTASPAKPRVISIAYPRLAPRVTSIARLPDARRSVRLIAREVDSSSLRQPPPGVHDATRIRTARRPPGRSGGRAGRRPGASLCSGPSISIAANRSSSSSPTGPGRESSCSTWRRSGTACARPSARPA